MSTHRNHSHAAGRQVAMQPVHVITAQRELALTVATGPVRFMGHGYAFVEHDRKRFKDIRGVGRPFRSYERVEKEPASHAFPSALDRASNHL